jgi:hypothetical protein
MNVEQSVEWELAVETEILGENPPSVSLFTTSGTWSDPGSNRAATVGSRWITAWAVARFIALRVTCLVFILVITPHPPLQGVASLWVVGKVVPVLNWTLRHEGVWGSGFIEPHFLDLGTRWRWVVSFMPRPLYHRGNSPRYPLDRSWVNLKSSLGDMEKWKFFRTPGLELRPISRAARSQSL